MIQNISFREFELRKDSFVVIDIRNIDKYNNSHIPNSINIPQEKLLIEPEKYLDENKPYCLYCTRGISSLKLVQILSKQGYKVVSLDGGYENWLLNN